MAAAIVLIHSMLVPVAVCIMLFLDGSEKGLWTTARQLPWRPIISAQSSLLAVYLGFAADSLYRRVGLSIVGTIYVTISLVWAYLMLSPSDLDLHTVMGHIQLASITVLLPTLSAGIVLLPFRRTLGTVQCEAAPGSSQYRIADLLVVIFLIAAVLGWSRLVSDHAAFQVRSLVSFHVTQTVAAVGCLLLALSQRRWWIGGLIVALSLLVQCIILRGELRFAWHEYSVRLAYRWGVVIMTLIGFRIGGMRLAALHRRSPGKNQLRLEK